MKATTKILLIFLILSSACSSSLYLTSGYDDDIYVSSREPVRDVKYTRVVTKTVPVEQKMALKQKIAVQENLAGDESKLKGDEVRYHLADSVFEEYVDEEGNKVN